MALLLRVCQGRSWPPRTVFPCLDAIAQPFFVALALAVDDVPEFGPVDRTKGPVTRRSVELQIRIRQRHAEQLRLRHRGVDELLSQLVVADALDTPLHRI